MHEDLKGVKNFRGVTGKTTLLPSGDSEKNIFVLTVKRKKTEIFFINERVARYSPMLDALIQINLPSGLFFDEKANLSLILLFISLFWKILKIIIIIIIGRKITDRILYIRSKNLVIYFYSYITNNRYVLQHKLLY